ncbi:Ig-like domain-containing protein [Rhodococcus sp. ARC_M6]|uniref:Ig-like domain-containing protein n=1 Tax=Rhodococcus sp. ARC_M6 TaxID=2928852 RepID=UPI001FB4B675|nr:Ig-like domain-containing protein [Rhodococcus sp. ARC_M6]MCJ0902358.1 Ig-like domain-containing protein [Rhodococcus sp. ARC_M6]
MSASSVRRVVSGVSAFAVAAGFAVVGIGVANAAPGVSTWSANGYNFTRTISNVNPAEGEEITSTTKLDRTGILQYLKQVKDVHPSCLTYKAGSATVDNVPVPDVAVDPAFARAEGTWTMNSDGISGKKSRTFEFTYIVGADCERGKDLNTSVHIGWSGGNAAYDSKGPNINVQMNQSSTALAPISGAQVGEPTTLSATVTGGANGDPVDFFNAGNKIGSGALNSGIATYAWTPTTQGSASISAKFADTTKAVGSQSAAQNMNVTQADASSTTTLAGISGAQVGKSTTLKATVSPKAAGGTVTFKIGSTTLADVPVNGNGEATYAWVPAVAGSQTIDASFSGRDGVKPSSTSTATTVADKPADITESKTSVSVDGGQVGVAQSISAQITPGTAGGDVTFKDGDTVIGTAKVDANGKATLNWTPTVAGQRTVKAEFSGSGNIAASDESISVQVAPAANGGGTGSAGSSTGSLGSLGNIFGS